MIYRSSPLLSTFTYQKSPHPMSSRSVLPSPPRTPLSNLDVHGNTTYSPNPSSLYATAKTSQSKFIDTVRLRHDNSQSNSGSPHGLIDNTSISPSNSADGMLSETGKKTERCGRTWQETPPNPATGILPSGDDFAMLTPTPKSHAATRTPRKATPPALLLQESLFVTPPKATIHYPHVLEPITERASVATLRTCLTPSNASVTSFTLSTPHMCTLEASTPPPPPRVPTPLTHPIFKMAQTERPRHVSASAPCLRDRFLRSAATTPTEHDSKVHTARFSHGAAMPSRERCSDASLAVPRLRAIGRILDRHYHPWDMLARRPIRQQKMTGRQKGTVATATMGTNRKHSNTNGRTRAEKRGTRMTSKDKLRKRARSGPKKIRKSWDKVREKMAWVFCGCSANSTGRG